MAANIGSVLDQLKAAGLIISGGPVLGRLTRCLVEGRGREKCGWYSLHEVSASNGDRLIVGSYGIWTGADNNAQKIELRKSELTSEQREAIRKRLAEDRKRAERMQAERNRRAAAQAQKAWKVCSHSGESRYLAAKGVQGIGVRYSPSGALVIPVLDTAGVIHGLQVIRDREQAKNDRAPEKEFWPAGVAKKGHFHLMGAPGAVVLVAEGYATAASLHMATSLPVAVAFDANNLLPVAEALRKRYKLARILFCADDDATQKCRHCRQRVWLPDGPECPHCGQPHEARNAGIEAASNAALAVDGAWIAPRFGSDETQRAAWLETGGKANDFNDLHAAEGLHVVRTQVEARLLELGWRTVRAPHKEPPKPGLEDDEDDRLRPLQSVDELLKRYALVYAHSGAVFDRKEHMLMSLSDMRDACVRRDIHRAWCESPDRDIVRIREVGFDPGGDDPEITCNLWAGWPTKPVKGRCEKLLEMLWHMCSGDREADRLYQWVLRWLAYPLQHPGAKMKTTIVVHGPQGTGKNLFFETISSIYGQYGDVIDQSAVEDKFNDWASRKLFMIADEVVARTDLFHIKNRLKSLITGDRIRINPKNFAAYWERNHMNLVFLSNETMPVVLEEDDRRHCIIWTPPKREPAFYQSVLDEIQAGGAAALHDYLMNIDLGDFNPGATAPMTEAKHNLIGLGLDSPTRFYYALYELEIGNVTPRPALSTDVYHLYKIWCAQTSNRAAPMQKFIDQITRKHGVRLERRRFSIGPVDEKYPRKVLMLGQPEPPEGRDPKEWLGQQIEIFRSDCAAFQEHRS